MSRRVDDLEGTVAEIDHVAMLEQAAGWGGQDTVARRVPALGHAIEHLPIGVAVGDRPFVARVGEDFRFSGMHAAVRKFVMAADMIEMRVAGDTD